MAEHPILFSGPMVRAILEGRKTQTRRVVKPQPIPMAHQGATWGEKEGFEFQKLWMGKTGFAGSAVKFCPYGLHGDRLWVREGFGYDHSKAVKDSVIYRADYSDDRLVTSVTGERKEKSGNYRSTNHWYPSIHMRREFSRITLEITDVRVERLQEITFKACIAEGVHPIRPENDPACVRSEFQQGWDSLNAKRGYSWESNPWVWVVSFSPVGDAP